MLVVVVDARRGSRSSSPRSSTMLADRHAHALVRRRRRLRRAAPRVARRRSSPSRRPRPRAARGLGLGGAARGVLGRLAELVLERLARLVGELGELAQRRQILERLQPEELEEVARRAVNQGPSGLVALAEDAHEIALEQELQHGAAVDAAHVVDLGTRDRLPVRDDRERLDLRAREAHGLLLREVADERRVLRARAEDPAAGHLVEVHAARRVVVLQLGEELLHLLLRAPTRAWRAPSA